MKKLLRKPVRFKGLTVGLDLHKKFIEFAVLDEPGDQIDGGRLDSNRKELAQFMSKLQARGKVQVAFEACGCFIWVYDLLIKILGRQQQQGGALGLDAIGHGLLAV